MPNRLRMPQPPIYLQTRPASRCLSSATQRRPHLEIISISIANKFNGSSILNLVWLPLQVKLAPPMPPADRPDSAVQPFSSIKAADLAEVPAALLAEEAGLDW